jgi:hypothetical protein
MAAIRGGEKFEAALRQIADLLGDGGGVRVGFLEGATYPGGTPVAMVAAIQDGGAPGAGIPPRPFFRNMIAEKSPEWPAAIGQLLIDHNYDVEKVLTLTGQAIAGQLRQSIVDTNDPPLAPSTIARKGHSKPLVASGHMLNSVDFEVKT